MPRNTKKRTPTEPIEVKIGEAGALGCARCGQAFPHVFNTRMAEHVMALNAEGFESRPDGGRVRYGEQAEEWLEVMSILTWGWKFDGTTWRPTAEHRARRQWAREVLRRPELYTDHDAKMARQGIAGGSFPRTEKGRVPISEIRPTALTKEIAQRFTLPTMIECIQCDAVNHVTRAD